MDLSHSHPPTLSSRSEGSAQSTLPRLESARSGPHTPLPVTPLRQHDGPFSLQHRRLLLRNAGFRASHFPSHRITSRLSRLFGSQETPQSDPPPPNQENNTPHYSVNSLSSSESRHLSTLGILSEISNSTRNRYSGQKSKIPILEDNPERPLLDPSPAATPGSCYHDASSAQNSPFLFDSPDQSDRTMRLREVSGNERRTPPPLASPLLRQKRSRKKRALDFRKASFEASQYIEHIENELQQVMEAMHSPNTGKPLHDKLKAVMTENKQFTRTIADLQRTMNEFEETFEERVKEAVEHKTGIELELRRKIKALEDEIMLKDCAIRDLEYCNEQSMHDRGSIETLKTTVERLESEKQNLEASNRVVEKRNNALTELLAMSPTKSQHSFELASPIRTESRCTPRPRSVVIPKLSTSSRPAQWNRPHSVQASPALPHGGFASPTSALDKESDRPRRISASFESQIQSDSESLDPGIDLFCSVTSPILASSKRSSTLSYGSLSPSIWGLPLPISPTDDKGTVRPNKHRKTRRFESGSTQLKPLLLPAIAADGNSYRLEGDTSVISSAAQGDISDESLDPTTTFLSRLVDTPPLSGNASCCWASEEALQALEGASCSHFESLGDIMSQHEATLPGDSSPSATGGRLHKITEDIITPDGLNRIDHDGNATKSLSLPPSKPGGDVSTASMTGEASVTVSGADPSRKVDHELASDYLESAATGKKAVVGRSAVSDQTPIGSSWKMTPEPPSLPILPIGRTQYRLEMWKVQVPQTLLQADLEPHPRKRPRWDDCTTLSDAFSTPSPLSIQGPCEPDGQESEKHDETSFDGGPEKTPPNCKVGNQPRSPIEILQQTSGPAIPLPSVTARTIFGTVSRYTSYIREARRDPTALARRVIANAWCSNWRRLGKLSWWVLGLFLGPGARRAFVHDPENGEWGLEAYDGEGIAEQACDADAQNRQCERVVTQKEPEYSRRVQFDNRDQGYRTYGTKAQSKPAPKEDSESKKTSWGRSLMLWGKFSIAIMLALGGAVVKGPGEMLRDCEAHKTRARRVAPRPNLEEWEGSEQTGETSPGEHGALVPLETKKLTPPRVLSRGNDDSCSGIGDGPNPGILRPTQSSLRTPSPARRKPLSRNAHAATKTTCIFSSPRRGEDGCENVLKDSWHRAPCTSPTKEADQTLGTLQWVQNLSISDFRDMDEAPSPARRSSRKSKRPHSVLD